MIEMAKEFLDNLQVRKTIKYCYVYCSMIFVFEIIGQIEVV